MFLLLSTNRPSYAQDKRRLDQLLASLLLSKAITILISLAESRKTQFNYYNNRVEELSQDEAEIDGFELRKGRR